jgi:hypothetical protein
MISLVMQVKRKESTDYLTLVLYINDNNNRNK